MGLEVSTKLLLHATHLLREAHPASAHFGRLGRNAAVGPSTYADLSQVLAEVQSDPDGRGTFQGDPVFRARQELFKKQRERDAEGGIMAGAANPSPHVSENSRQNKVRMAAKTRISLVESM